VQGTSGKDKAMPNGVGVRNFFTGVEEYSGGVCDSTGYQESETNGRKREVNGLDKKDNEPTHRNVHQ